MPPNVRIWVARSVFFMVAVACVWFLDGGAWFYGGLCLGWLWAVLESAAQHYHHGQGR